jgi:hypothetical protein
MIDADGNKRCPKCKRTLPANRFYKNASSKDGRSVYCQICSAAYSKKIYASKPRKNYQTNGSLAAGACRVTLTIQDMMDETEVTGGTIRAYLSRWVRRGGAVVLPNRTEDRANPRRPGPWGVKMYDVKQGVWNRFLRRDQRAPLDILKMGGREYLREVKYRYRSRSAWPIRKWRMLRVESFARRYPFVVL